MRCMQADLFQDRMTEIFNVFHLNRLGIDVTKYRLDPTIPNRVPFFPGARFLICPCLKLPISLPGMAHAADRIRLGGRARRNALLVFGPFVVKPSRLSPGFGAIRAKAPSGKA